MKNILVTGGCGFIGSNFIKHLIDKEEYHIVILDKLTYAGNLNNLDLFDIAKCTFINGDICDEKKLSELFEKFRFFAIFHFAAESHVDRSIDGPGQFIKTNIIGTFNLLEASRSYFQTLDPKFKFIHISTDEVYGDLKDNDFFKETTAYNPSSPYSATKASSDHLVKAWGRTYGIPYIITNCSNNYGRFQFPEKLIPLMIINCIDWNPLPIYGNGQNIRDWLFVKDHCIAIDLVFNKGCIGETYNIGGNNEIKNLEIVNTICDIMNELKPSQNGDYKKLITFVKDRPGHDFRYAIDSTKINKELGWKPSETFFSGIRKTIKWYIENENWWREIQKEKYNQERLGG